MKYIITTLIGFIALFASGLAYAADPFTVVGVPVDATGDTPIEAQTLATQDGQARAANILIERLTLESERLSKGLVPIEIETAQKMIRAMKVDSEKRSASRYLGDITVAFSPREIQKYLEANDLNMISTQARTRLVVPVLEGYPLWDMNPWSMVWQDGRYSHALTPVKAVGLGQGDDAIITSAEASAADMEALKRLGERFGAEQVLIVRTSGGTSARVTDIAIDTGLRRDLGRISGGDYNDLAANIVEMMEKDWKRASVTVAENAVSMPVSILYESQSEWLRLKDAINGSAQIQDARLDALSKDGAVMTITYGGDMNRLANELAFKGVDVRTDPKLGVVLARTGYFRE